MLRLKMHQPIRQFGPFFRSDGRLESKAGQTGQRCFGQAVGPTAQYRIGQARKRVSCCAYQVGCKDEVLGHARLGLPTEIYDQGCHMQALDMKHNKLTTLLRQSVL